MPTGTWEKNFLSSGLHYTARHDCSEGINVHSIHRNSVIKYNCWGIAEIITTFNNATKSKTPLAGISEEDAVEGVRKIWRRWQRRRSVLQMGFTKETLLMVMRMGRGAWTKAPTIAHLILFYLAAAPTFSEASRWASWQSIWLKISSGSEADQDWRLQWFEHTQILMWASVEQVQRSTKRSSTRQRSNALLRIQHQPTRRADPRLGLVRERERQRGGGGGSSPCICSSRRVVEGFWQLRARWWRGAQHRSMTIWDVGGITIAWTPIRERHQ